jgi:hypothetical protein
MKKMITAGVMAALSAAGMVAGAGSASATNRVDCDESGYTYMISPATTCWANAGTIGVTLYDVSAIASGNNIGWVASPSGYVDFPARWTVYHFSTRRVDTIHIN